MGTVTTETGCPGTGRLNAALPGSRVECTDAKGVTVIILKRESGLWGFGFRIGETEQLPATAATDAKGVEWYCFKHSADFASIVFSGAVGEVASLPVTACRRCGGTGTVPQYRHIDGGRCYDCGGDGVRRGRR